MPRLGRRRMTVAAIGLVAIAVAACGGEAGTTAAPDGLEQRLGAACREYRAEVAQLASSPATQREYRAMLLERLTSAERLDAAIRREDPTDKRRARLLSATAELVGRTNDFQRVLVEDTGFRSKVESFGVGLRSAEERLQDAVARTGVDCPTR